jgi:hypothetical protein
VQKRTGYCETGKEKRQNIRTKWTELEWVTLIKLPKDTFLKPTDIGYRALD